MDYDDGEVFVNPHKKIGLISQIPKFPAGYTVEDVLRCAYTQLHSIKRKMEQLEKQMLTGATDQLLKEYDRLTNQFESGGGYEMDVEVDKVCNGLGISAAVAAKDGDAFSFLDVKGQAFQQVFTDDEEFC